MAKISVTISCAEDVMDRAKAIASEEGRQIDDIVEEGLRAYIISRGNILIKECELCGEREIFIDEQ